MVTVAALAGLQVTLLGAMPARADIARSSEQWVLGELSLPSAWSVSQGKGVVVAVIDSGANASVSDLAGSVTTGPNFTGVGTPPSDPNWGVHGTWMASLIAGHGHDGGASGILGSAPQSTVLSIRVITDGTDPNNAKYQAESAARGQRELANAITYAVNHRVQVISMSLGYNLQSRPVRAALQDAYEHNVVVVASAGNSGNAAGATGTGQAPYSFPADYPGVLAVGAVSSSGQVSSFSSENLSVQVAAPGVRVPAQGRDGGYWYVSGTSPACALTAGVVALIKAKYPTLTDSQVISAITSSTRPSTRPPDGWDEQIGFGVVDAAAALTAAGHLAAGPPPAPGLAGVAHFGGGPAAIPPVPVAPRGSAGLVLYCLLGAACLGLVALATSRLLSSGDLPAREPAQLAGSGPGHDDPARPVPPSGLLPLPGPVSSSGPVSPSGPVSSSGPVSPSGPVPPAVPLPLPAPPSTARHAAPRGRGHNTAGPS
jgi:subtilisin family serine protease